MTSRDAIGDHGTQNALVFRGVRDVRLERVPIPTLRDDADAIVAIDLCGLCGSDMHPYHGREQGLDAGTTCGHEFVGRVAAVGAAVRRWRVGDRVMSPFTTCCGGCFHCRRGLPCRCPEGKLFGWVEGGQGLQGAQAEFVRVPLADATLAAVPAGLSDEEALLLGDVFSTGFFAADNAGIKEYAAEAARRAWAPAGGAKEGGGEGPVVAVVGCGPVGLMAVIGALELGAARVFAVDSVAERLDLARRFGAVPVDRAARDPGAALRAATDGRGADVVIEAVGAPEALSLALELVRDGGALSSCGCHSAAAVPLAALYNKNLTLKSGRCPARAYMDKLLPLVQSKKYDITAIITHRLPLDQDAPRAYTMFDQKVDGCIKVVLVPGRGSGGGGGGGGGGGARGSGGGGGGERGSEP